MLFRRGESNPNSFWHRTFGPTVGAVAVFLIEVIQIVAVSAAIIIPIRYFLIQPFYVKGASMEPEFLTMNTLSSTSSPIVLVIGAWGDHRLSLSARSEPVLY